MAAQRGPCFSTDARALYDDDAADHAERDHVHRTRALGDAHRGEIRAARDHPAAADAADAGLGASGVSEGRYPARPDAVAAASPAPTLAAVAKTGEMSAKTRKSAMRSPC